MREILFRGIHERTGKFVYGDLYHSYSGDIFIQPHYSNVVRVIPETVGQYTGLKDKNGKEIFEGDIIQTCFYAADWMKPEEYHISTSVVKYENGCFVLSDTYSSDGYNEISCIYEEISGLNGYLDECIFNIIGNIHENPELLKD